MSSRLPVRFVNGWATYLPLKPLRSPIKVGELMYIDIYGPINANVKFSEIKLSENSFFIKALTLEGHPDAGFITFGGTFNPETQEIDFTIYNETTGNIGMEAMTIGSAFSRYAQHEQWKIVLDNVEKFIGGELYKKFMKKEVSIRNPTNETGSMYHTEDLITGEKTEKLKSSSNGG